MTGTAGLTLVRSCRPRGITWIQKRCLYLSKEERTGQAKEAISQQLQSEPAQHSQLTVASVRTMRRVQMTCNIFKCQSFQPRQPD